MMATKANLMDMRSIAITQHLKLNHISIKTRMIQFSRLLNNTTQLMILKLKLDNLSLV